MRWDEMGWDGMGWDGMGWDGMGWDGIGWPNVRFEDGECCERGLSRERVLSAKQEACFERYAGSMF
ncbi:hypothetical protein BC936DRAFT_146258 [Jimgerdemannia flammicorona]|uniref:Uncharacterized protein n=1 Tax=Jimgerdemannia flammicorona TaxID=994334 RepID=A0A433DLI5_9FUNG|nr:hypothetical protein BC936DRAFT_146258 [Jimgerdemannia flammicorona]